MERKITHLFILVILFLVSCTSSVEHTLELHGVPLTFSAPANTEINFYDRIVLKEVHINHRDFRMQLLILDAATQPDSVFFDRQRDQISNHARFSQFHKESDRGFIYSFKKQKKGSKATHGIRYVLRNDSYIAVFKEFENQRVDLSTARQMYKIASSASWLE